LICNHCGLCCIDYEVVIISPEWAKKEIIIDHNLPEEAFIHKKSGNPCPHLYWEDEESRCKIHNMPWYKDTPCYQFGQIESSPDCICRLGEYIWSKKPGYYKRYCDEFTKNVLPLDDFVIMMNKRFINDEKEKHSET
jgi:hypothetical protein